MTSTPETPQTSRQQTLLAERTSRIAAALTRYRVAAWITGCWLLILTAEMVYKYLILSDSSLAPSWFTYIGMAHGLFYMIYLVTTFDLGTKARWTVGTMLLTALAGTIPFLSFVAEHRRTQDVKQKYAV